MKLYAHQQKIIDEDPKQTGLWLGTGSGKTRIALMVAKGDILIIAPKTQVEDRNWEREYMAIIEDKVKGYKNSERIKMVKPTITVMSKEEFRRDSIHLPRFNTVIVDEAHTCLGVTPNVRFVKKQAIPKTSQLFEALDLYVKRTKPERLYLVSATIIKSPMTVWGAATILGNNWNWYEFRQTFYTRLPMPGREVWMAKKDAATKDRLAAAVRTLGYTGRLEDYFDVPEQSFKLDHIELTTAQQARIKEMKMEYPEPIVRVGKIHQIENGVLAGNEFSYPESFANGKIDRILEYATEFPKMVIFAKYRHQIMNIESALSANGYKTFTLTGDTKDRGAVIKEADAAKEGIFIAQSQVSAGWELPSYPVMIFASQTYSFVDDVQARGRILRANALKKNLFINLVVKGGIDEAVYDCIANKKDFDERIYTEQDNY